MESNAGFSSACALKRSHRTCKLSQKSADTPKNLAKVLAVPQSAIVLENNNYFVMKEAGHNVFEKVQIKVGKNYDRNTEVVAGLKEGDHIISEGSLFVLTGYNLK